MSILIGIILNLILLLPTVGYSTSIPEKIWGNTPDNNMQFGAPIVHVTKTGRKALLLRPYVGLTYHTLYATYLQGCDYDNGIGLGIQRELLSYQNNNQKVSLGYRAGGLYGAYCMKNFHYSTAHNCQGGQLLVPIIQAIVDYQYKQVGLELGFMGPVATLSAVYHFSGLM